MNLPPEKASAATPVVSPARQLENACRNERQKSVLLRELAHERRAMLEATARDTEVAIGKLLFWRRR
jgi:hypothetical protein